MYTNYENLSIKNICQYWFIRWNFMNSQKWGYHLQFCSGFDVFPGLGALRQSPHGPTLRPYRTIKMINNGDRGIFKNNQIPWWCHQFFSRRALNSGYKTMDSPSSTFSWSYFFLMSSSQKASVFIVFREFIIFNYGLNLFNLAGIKRRNNYIPKISERRLPFFRCIAPKLFEFLVILHGCVMFLDRTLQIFGHNNSYQFLIS